MDVTALRAALDAHRRAVGLSPEGSADHAMHLTNLGAVLLDAAVVLPEEVGLDETVAVLEAAVAQTHAASPHRGGRWNNLAAALRTMADRSRADRSRAAADAERAHTAFREAVASSTPEAGLSAAVTWSSWSVERTAWPEIAEASTRALDTADRLRRTQLTRGDRTSWLRRVEGLSAAGAHADARLGDPAAAALLAERGRALLLSDALDRDRTRLERLAATRPDLAARFSAAAVAVRELESLRGV